MSIRSRLRVLFVFGTRPEAIKLAPVIRELASRPSFRVSVCVTAQHRGLLDQVLRVFRLRPDYDLDIMAERQSLFQVTTRTLTRLEPVLKQERPGVLFVQGDTTSAFAAALSAFYERIPVAHVEAGLRTYDLSQPYPEELNRRLISPIAQFNFAPTWVARENLRAERIPDETIFVTGNTVIDALLQITGGIRGQGSGKNVKCQMSNVKCPGTRDLQSSIFNLQSSIRTPDSRFPTPGRRLILVTAHRRENFGAPLANICRALLRIAQQVPDVEIVYPVHPNPQVREPVQRLLGRTERIHLLAPLDYLPFAQLLRRSYLVLSDSGGIQEEAPALGKPVLVLRDKTERPEAIQAGTARLVGTETERIVRTALRLLRSPAAYRKMARARNPFGDGRASVRIADFLEFRHGIRRRPPREFTV